MGAIIMQQREPDFFGSPGPHLVHSYALIRTKAAFRNDGFPQSAERTWIPDQQVKNKEAGPQQKRAGPP